MIIDCHAHAYPSLGEQIERLSPRVAEKARSYAHWVARRTPAAVKAHLASTLGRTMVDVEGVAGLRRRSKASHHLEPLLSLTLIPQLVTQGTVDHLFASMKRHGIARTVLIAAGPAAPNEWVLAQARASGGRLVPVVNVPALGKDATEDMWRDALTALADDGARGLKLHLNMDGLGHDHRGYRVAFEVAQARKLPIIIHTGCFHVPGYKITSDAEPALFAPLFERFPDVRVCLAHMNRDTPERAWAMMKRFASVYTDTSWQPREMVERAAREVGSERLLLGSDWPLLHPDLQGDVLHILRAALGDAGAERVGWANAQAFLGAPPS